VTVTDLSHLTFKYGAGVLLPSTKALVGY